MQLNQVQPARERKHMFAVDPTNHDDEQCTSGRVKSDITVLLFKMTDRSLIVSHDRVVVYSRVSTSALVVPTTRLAFGDRGFYVAAARTWNSLPFGLTSTSSLSTFRRQLKTLLVTRSYHDSLHRT